MCPRQGTTLLGAEQCDGGKLLRRPSLQQDLKKYAIGALANIKAFDSNNDAMDLELKEAIERRRLLDGAQEVLLALCLSARPQQKYGIGIHTRQPSTPCGDSSSQSTS